MTPTPRHHSARRVVFGTLITLFLLAFTAPASHADSFTYWSLWEGQSGKWVASSTGASDMKLANKSVIAAKYLNTDGDLTAADAPTKSAEYKKLCPDSKAPETDSVNVAVVLDYGDSSLTPAEESTPPAEVSCVTVKTPATAATALSHASAVSASADGFIIAINDYPNSDAATAAEEGNTQSEETQGVEVVTVLVSVAILLLIVVVAVVMVKRRGDDDQ